MTAARLGHRRAARDSPPRPARASWHAGRRHLRQPGHDRPAGDAHQVRPEASFRSSERASATATLRARGKTIAKGSAKARSGAISLRLHLTSAGRAMLCPPATSSRRRLTLTLRDASGNRRALKKTLTVRGRERPAPSSEAR